MPAFMISYDKQSDHEYTDLIAALRQLGCVSPLESVWFGSLNGNAETVRNVLGNFIDANDGLLVVEMPSGSDWATYSVNEGADHWLSAFVSQGVNSPLNPPQVRRGFAGPGLGFIR